MLENNAAAAEELSRRTAELSLGDGLDSIGPASAPDPLGEIADSVEARQELDRKLEEESSSHTLGRGSQQRELDALTVVEETAFLT